MLSPDDDPNEITDSRTIPFAQIGYDVVDRFGSLIGPYGCCVYLTLIRYAGASGSGWPSHKTIADKWKIGINTVKRTLDLLEEHKLIRIEKRTRSNGAKTSNLYTILEPPKLPPIAHTGLSPSPHGATPIAHTGLSNEIDTGINKIQGKEETPRTENPATVIGRDLPGLLNAPKPPSRIKVLVDRLYTKLVSRRKIAKGQRVDLSSWEEQARKFITSQDIPLDEFERMLNWWCDHVGEEFVVRKGIESAGGFCKNYAAVLESYESRQHDNHKKINGAVNGHVVESSFAPEEIKTSTEYRKPTEAERQALIQG